MSKCANSHEEMLLIKLAGGALSAKQRRLLEMEVFFKVSPYAAKMAIHLYMWARQYPVTDAAQEAEVDKGTAIDVYQWFREVCSTKLLQTLDP